MKAAQNMKIENMIKNRFFRQAMSELGVSRGEMLYRDKKSFEVKGVDA